MISKLSKLFILVLVIASLPAHSIDELKDKRIKDENMKEKDTEKGMGLGRKNCFTVSSTRERLCDALAEKWCNEHKEEKICRRFINVDVSKP
jgi:hypothetical protein